MKKILTWSVFIVSTCIFTVNFYNRYPATPFQTFFVTCFVSGALALIVPCIYQIKRRNEASFLPCAYFGRPQYVVTGLQNSESQAMNLAFGRLRRGRVQEVSYILPPSITKH